MRRAAVLSPAMATFDVEAMGARRWRRGDADRRQAKLDTARPPGAPPPAPIVAFEPVAGDGDGDVVVVAGAGDGDGAGNGEPSMQDSAVSAHSSPEATADGDVVGVEAPAEGPDAEESAVSVPGSEAPADTESDADADKKE